MKMLVGAVAAICTFAICGLLHWVSVNQGQSPFLLLHPSYRAKKSLSPSRHPSSLCLHRRLRHLREGKRREGFLLKFVFPGEEMRIRADFLTEDTARKLVIGEGFVDVQYLGNRLQADRVQINFESGRASPRAM